MCGHKIDCSAIGYIYEKVMEKILIRAGLNTSTRRIFLPADEHLPTPLNSIDLLQLIKTQDKFGLTCIINTCIT